MKSSYVRRLFLWLVYHVPGFDEEAYKWVMDCERQVHGVMLKPDWIERAREQLAARD